MSNARNIASIAGEDVLNASNQIVPVYACRAWVNFNGGTVTNPASTTGIYADGNVSTILDHGNGDYTINFETPMPDANYAVVITGEDTNAGSGNAARGSQVRADGRAAGSVRVQNWGWVGNPQDIELSVVIIH
jgi:hypothetical protein